MMLEAKSDDEARKLAEEAQARRHARFPLTFNRLEQSLQTGEMHGLLAAVPKGAEKEFSKQMVKAQIELRKKDQARYDDGEWKVKSVEKLS